MSQKILELVPNQLVIHNGVVFKVVKHVAGMGFTARRYIEQDRDETYSFSSDIEFFKSGTLVTPLSEMIDAHEDKKS